MIGLIHASRTAFIGIYVYQLLYVFCSEPSEWAVKLLYASEADAISSSTGLVNKGRVKEIRYETYVILKSNKLGLVRW
jgi:hypothetical protein